MTELDSTRTPDDGPASPRDPSCCAREVASVPPAAASRAGILSSAGAVVSAALGSACCWLPLLLVTFGASAAGVAGFFEQYRLAFLGVAGVFLGVGFYFAYSRKAPCGPDGVCAAPSRRVQRLNRAVLWVATVLVVAAGAFPQYVGAFLPRGGAPTTQARGAQASFSNTGMTCEACAATIRAELERLPGVAQADVSFERKTATIVAAEGAPLPSDEAALAAVQRAGYVAERVRQGVVQ